jgi:hypothetical protein
LISNAEGLSADLALNNLTSCIKKRANGAANSTLALTINPLAGERDQWLTAILIWRDEVGQTEARAS